MPEVAGSGPVAPASRSDYLQAVLGTLLQLLLAPALVGASTLAAARWHERVGGVVSAFPAIVGPLLLLAATQHGGAFAARAASGVLVGMLALGGFAVVYAWVSRSRGWVTSLGAAWAAAVVLGALVAGSDASPAAAALIAVVSLGVAAWSMPRGLAPTADRVAGDPDVATRMVVALGLVGALAVAADRLGPVVGGVLAALPVLASVLVCATHRRHGAAAATEFLRGMLTGLGGFVAFCVVVAALATVAGTAAAFMLALAAALIAQGLALVAAPAAGR